MTEAIQRPNFLEVDPSHEALRTVLKATLIGIASKSRDPVAYLDGARGELTQALMKLELPDGAPGRDVTREWIAKAMEQVWPEVVAHFSN